MFDDEPVRRTLSRRDREELWRRAGKKCENCGHALDYPDMEVGHKTAWSKGGNTTLRNSRCLCHSCNRRQGTDHWAKFQRKLGNQSQAAKTKQELSSFGTTQLRNLAKKKGIKVKGRFVEGDLFSFSYRAPPAKKQFINALSKVVSASDISSARRAKPVKKRRHRQSSWSLW